MGANLCWEPANRPTKDVPTSAPQRMLEVLRKLTETSGQEFVLADYHLPALAALAETCEWGSAERNPYKTLIDAINKHGSIRVWAQY